MNSYDNGDLVRLSVVFTDALAALADPTTTTLLVRVAGETATTYTSGSTPPVVHDSTGNYHFDLLIPDRSNVNLYYRWVGTGAVQAAAETVLHIKASQFP